MTFDDLKSRWQRRRDDFAEFSAQVDAVTLIDRLLADLEVATADCAAALLPVSQASARRGYSAGHRSPLARETHEPRLRAPDDAMLAAADAAKYLGLALQTLAKMRLSGGSPAYFKLGRRVLYKRADLDAWVAARRRRSTSDIGEG